MNILCKEQGTQEWRDARRGKITASAARLAIGRPGTKGRADYILKLVHDWEGVPDLEDEETPPWFLDGKYFESWARGWYSWQFDAVVKETGFIVHDDYSWLGCSPDGLIGDDGMLEVKFRKSLRTFHEHASIGVNKPVMAQVQTQLFVCDRRWCDYVNYWRSDDHELEKGRCKRIDRDQPYIDNVLLPAFVKIWTEAQALLLSRR